MARLDELEMKERRQTAIELARKAAEPSTSKVRPEELFANPDKIEKAKKKKDRKRSQEERNQMVGEADKKVVRKDVNNNEFDLGVILKILHIRLCHSQVDNSRPLD